MAKFPTMGVLGGAAVVPFSTASVIGSGSGISVRGAMVQYQKNTMMNTGTPIHI